MLEIYDPNTKTCKEYSRGLRSTNSPAVFNFAAQNYANQLRGDEKTQAALKYSLLTWDTALIAYERIT